MRIIFLSAAVVAVLAGCSQDAPGPENGQAGSQTKVTSTGKIPVPIDQIPADVLSVVKGSEPVFAVTEASNETRDGRNYYDIEGRLPDGSEVEFDLLQENGAWRVVERQRDIGIETVPEPVLNSFAKIENPYAPARIIESRQSDEIVIYELFSAALNGGEPRKVEVRYDGRHAEVLTQEWAH